MSSLNFREKNVFEELFAMKSGYVIDSTFTDKKFHDFFMDFGIDIDSEKYVKYGPSKANRLRSFWEQEPDNEVGPALNQLLLLSRDFISNTEPRFRKISEAEEIVRRLQGRKQSELTTLENISFTKLPISVPCRDMLEVLRKEACKCFNCEANFACVVLVGSMLEHIFYDIATHDPQKFNCSAKAPKTRDKKKDKQTACEFKDWTLQQFIEVAVSIKLIGPDLGDLADIVRDWRNYLHPNKSLSNKRIPSRADMAIIFLNKVVVEIEQASFSHDSY